MNSDAGADEGIQSALLMSLDHQNRGRGRISDKWHSMPVSDIKNISDLLGAFGRYYSSPVIVSFTL